MRIEVVTFPSPIRTVAGLTPEEPTITLDQLLSLTEVRAESWNDLVEFEIVSFKLIVVGGGRVSVLKSNSNKFTPEMMIKIDSFSKGSILHIENVKVQNPSGEVINGAPIQKIVY